MSKPKIKIVLAGSSQLAYPEAGEPTTIPSLVGRLLTERVPEVDWLTPSAVAYPRANMRDRVMSFVQKEQPQAVVLFLGGSTFAEETVQFAVYHRFPKLYPAVRALVDRSKGIAGGGLEGADSPRGLLFRVPRAIARRLIGTAPLIDPAEALSSVQATLQAMAGEESIQSLCLLPARQSQTKEFAERSMERTRHNNAGVSETCQNARYPLATTRSTF